MITNRFNYIAYQRNQITYWQLRDRFGKEKAVSLYAAMRGKF